MTYRTFAAAMDAIERGVADAEADMPELAGGPDIYHDIAQAIMWDCTDEVRREVSRCTGVALPYGMEGAR